MKFAAVLSISLACWVHAADPSCETGILSKEVGLCCARECGRCGGHGCGKLPGGSADCCAGPIQAAGKHCDEHGPPCLLTPTPVPPTPSSATAKLTLDTLTPVAVVDRKYVSFTFDSSAWRAYDLNGSDSTQPGAWGGTLDVLVQGMYPSHLRIGGTQGDYDVYTGFSPPRFPVGTACSSLPKPMTTYRCKEVTVEAFATLLSFSARNNLTLVYGLNDMYGRPTKTSPEKVLCSSQGGCPARDQSNLATLVEWLASSKPRGWDAIYAFELGNELNSCLNGAAGAKAQAADFSALQELVRKVWPTADGLDVRTPLMVGPDTHSAAEFSADGVEWFAQFAAAAESVVDFHTFHMYSLGNGPRLDPNKLSASYLSPTSLDRCGQGVRALRAATPSTVHRTLWAGETAAANQGGQSGITDTYIDGFWYLDQLGQLAALNVSVFLRQTMLAKAGYPLVQLFDSTPAKPPHPLPDYYIAVLHKRLMGQRVLLLSSSAPNVRAYAHCAAGSVGGGGGVTIAFLNIALNLTVAVTLPPALAAAPSREEFVLTAGDPMEGAVMPLQSRSILLNGELLALVPGADGAPPRLPELVGKTVVQPGSGADVLQLPPTSYGYVRFADANVAACK